MSNEAYDDISFLDPVMPENPSLLEKICKTNIYFLSTCKTNLNIVYIIYIDDTQLSKKC